MENCQTGNRPFLLATNSRAAVAIFFRPRCKRWSCPTCGQINKARWAFIASWGAQELIDSGFELGFVTVTHQGHLDAVRTRQRWRECWPKLIQAARRKAGGLEYFMVHEQHADGRLHTHLITSKQLGCRWWKNAGASRGFGYMNDERPVYNAAGAGFYASKYLAKGLEAGRWPQDWRRVGTSRGWPRRDDSAVSQGWEFRLLEKAHSVQDVRTQLITQGWKVLVSNHSDAWDQIAAVDAAIDYWEIF